MLFLIIVSVMKTLMSVRAMFFAYLDDVSKVKPAILNYIKELIDEAENNRTKQEVDYEKKRYERLKKWIFWKWILAL